MSESQVDYFISHAGADSAYAEWADQVLRRAGFTTITDVYDFQSGENFILLMSNALERGRKLLLIWTRHANRRFMVEREWSNAIASYKDRVIPVLIDDTKKPAILNATIHIDLSHMKSTDEAEAVLLQGLLGRPRPDEKLSFPGATPTSGELGHDSGARRWQPTYGNSPTQREYDKWIRPRSDQISFSNSAQNCSELWFAAKGFDSFLHDNARTISNRLEGGTRIRFLMNDPFNPDLMNSMALTSYSNRDADEVARRLQYALKQILTLRGKYPEQVQLRLAAWAIGTGYTFYDPLDKQARVYVEFFGYRLSLNERMGVEIHSQVSPVNYAHHLRNFQSQWADAKEA